MVRSPELADRPLGWVGGPDPKDRIDGVVKLTEARWQLRAGRPERALELLESQPEAGGWVAHVRSESALALGDAEEAERLYRRAIEVRPDYAASYVSLAWLLYGKLGPKEAADLVRGFVERYPYNHHAYEAAFEIIADGMNWSAGAAIAEEAVARNPDRVWPHILLAKSYTWQMAPTDQPERAVAAIERAMALRPSSSRVLM